MPPTSGAASPDAAAIALPPRRRLPHRSFHLLATEGTAQFDKDHLWYLAESARLVAGGDRLLLATTHRLVDVGDESGIEAATDWWSGLTGAGGEGMVVKPLTFIAQGRKGMAQPAIKCRGSDYLRIIYGAEHNLPENLSRWRGRSLAKNRSLAIREFLLGQEALHRFMDREPLRDVHEAVFAVLALESEPVDPRL